MDKCLLTANKLNSIIDNFKERMAEAKLDAIMKKK